jgi:Sulfotransferase family
VPPDWQETMADIAIADRAVAANAAPGKASAAKAGAAKAGAEKAVAEKAATGPKVFIMGPARSGTSIMYYAMREVFGLPGTGESHVIPVFDQMSRMFMSHVAKYKGMKVLASKLETEPFRRHLTDYMRTFYESAYPGGSWVDKTPGRLGGVALIAKSFPDARVIITRRTGIEMVVSHQTKFASEFEVACHLWARSMNDILTLRKRPATLTRIVLEQDQFDLTNNAAESAERIAVHLGQPAKAGELETFFRERRVQKSSEHSWERRLTLAETPWSDTEKDLFVRECGPMMEALSYPM